MAGVVESWKLKVDSQKLKVLKKISLMAGVVASKVRKQRAKERPSLKEADKEEKRPIKVHWNIILIW